jgi:hypothetical protein
MATTHIHVRDARDRLIDLLGLGQTYPLRDLAVSDKRLMVPFDTVARIPIKDSQKGVLYQLHHRHALVKRTETYEEGKEDSDVPIEVEGNGGTIDLETYKIQEDITFEIFAKKQQSGRETYLHQTTTVKVGLDTELNAWIRDVPYLDPTDESPPDPDTAPRIVDYGASVEVEIENSQEGVDYQLVYFKVAQSGEELEEDILSEADVRGDLHNIIATTHPVYEDTDIHIRATKTFDLSEEGDSQTVLLGVLLFNIGLEFEADLDGGTISEALLEVFADQNFPLQNAIVEGQSPLWLMSNADKTTFTVRKEGDHLNIYRDKVLPLKVRANPALPVSVPTPIIDYNNRATIKITDTQLSTEYQLYIRPIPDREFVHKEVPDTEVIIISVEGESDVQVQKPAREGIWTFPEGYVELGGAQDGTGGELELKTGSLTDDSLVIVRARKNHQASSDSQTAKTVSSAVQLEQTAVILVRPNPAPPLRVRMLTEETDIGRPVRADSSDFGAP